MGVGRHRLDTKDLWQAQRLRYEAARATADGVRRQVIVYVIARRIT